MLLSALGVLGSISRSIYAGHLYFEILEDIWNEFFETYNKVDGSMVFNIY